MRTVTQLCLHTPKPSGLPVDDIAVILGRLPVLEHPMSRRVQPNRISKAELNQIQLQHLQVVSIAVCEVPVKRSSMIGNQPGGYTG